jgi:amidase
MDTSVGTRALQSMVVKNGTNAGLLENLLAAGLVILGKADLTELGGIRDDAIPSDYRDAGGKTQSPFYVASDRPAITGGLRVSAVSVEAGFSPLAITTDGNGSLILSAAQGGLYAIALSHDSVETDGVWLNDKSYCTTGLVSWLATRTIWSHWLLSCKRRCPV